LGKQTIIKVENLSKHYLLNKSKQSPEDTLLTNLITQFKGIGKQKHIEEFKALDNVSFEIEQGDRVGIIGRNGAGKSTLLKILSRITPPTKGRIEINGRLASLLEVGTGFHGDLSGRENIYLNGSILGMTKKEIDTKFDEIVAFSEIEKFLDTPVKRYSSGMYVRLAFAVAAHLEPEILIVDEVLAVGDAAFQKKCLGKMEDVSTKEGRTILFVSHNMGQINSLCNTAILLNKGKVEQQGDLQNIINTYFNFSGNEDITAFNYPNLNDKELFIEQIIIQNENGEQSKNFAHDEAIHLSIKINNHKWLNDVLLSVHFYDVYDKRIFTAEIPVSDIMKAESTKTFLLKLPASFLVPNSYYFKVGLHIPNIQIVDFKEQVANIHIYDNGSKFYKYPIGDSGLVFVNETWVY
jgi:lipopolysaccharide transport system ATP-binding protein